MNLHMPMTAVLTTFVGPANRIPRAPNMDPTTVPMRSRAQSIESSSIGNSVRSSPVMAGVVAPTAINPTDIACTRIPKFLRKRRQDVREDQPRSVAGCYCGLAPVLHADEHRQAAGKNCADDCREHVRVHVQVAGRHVRFLRWGQGAGSCEEQRQCRSPDSRAPA